MFGNVIYCTRRHRLDVATLFRGRLQTSGANTTAVWSHLHLCWKSLHSGNVCFSSGVLKLSAHTCADTAVRYFYETIANWKLQPFFVDDYKLSSERYSQHVCGAAIGPYGGVGDIIYRRSAPGHCVFAAYPNQKIESDQRHNWCRMTRVHVPRPQGDRITSVPGGKLTETIVYPMGEFVKRETCGRL